MIENSKNNGKIIYLEVLRVFAILCVMFNHSGPRGSNYYLYTDSDICYFLSLVGNIVCNIGVPLFLMISDVLLLNKEETIKKVYSKRLPRMIIILVIFSIIRYMYECFVVEKTAFSFMYFIKVMLEGKLFLPYWYLYLYISIRIILPFLRKICRNITMQEGKCFIVLCLLFFCIIPVKKNIRF